MGRNITEGCKYVLYCISIGTNVTDIHPIDNYWGNEVSCSVLFLSRSSILAHRKNLQSVSQWRNWTVILVDELEEFSNPRKACKVPKLSPKAFLASSVTHAVYIDSKLILKQNPIQIIEAHMRSSDNIIIVGIKHPHSSTITDEMVAIWEAMKHRPLVTYNFSMVYHQTMYYQQMASTLGHDNGYNLIDAAFLIHNLQLDAARSFRCLWQEEINAWSDRDQIAFPYVLAELSKGLNQSRGAEFLLIPVYIKDSYSHQVKILTDSKYYWDDDNGVLATHYRNPWNY